MIDRQESRQILDLLASFPAVAILGPRQVGKTTLARALTGHIKSAYLDLENPEDRQTLSDPVPYLAANANQLIVIDEIQKAPDLFSALRGLIDQRRLAGHRHGQFLLLGSASRELLRQSSESLAGRIAYLELTPLLADEAITHPIDELWLRGGFPESLLAPSDRVSLTWRRNFITQYLERDLPLAGVRIPSETMRRLWTMLATAQGTNFNASVFAASLGLSPHTISAQVDILCDLMLLRRLSPWHANVGKRLVKSPRIYWKDTGLSHALLGIPAHRELLGHIAMGASWETFVISQLIAAAGSEVHPWFYRTAAGAEIDLLLELAPDRLWAIEIKHSTAPAVSKGFHLACDDLKPARRLVIHAGDRTWTGSNGVEYLPLREMMLELRKHAN